MKSRYNGWCVKCKQEISKGEEISKDPGLKKWVHETCPTSVTKGETKTALDILTSNAIVEDDLSEMFNTSFTPSKYQQEIFDFIEHGEGNGVVEAVAGSGKTTTIVKALEKLPRNMRVAFFAFNVHIAKELDKRLKTMGLYNVKASTIHSFGLSICRKMPELEKGKKGVDPDKLSGLMDRWYPITRDVESATRRVNRGKRQQMRGIVALAKATLVDYNDSTAVYEMIDRYNIDVTLDTDELVSKLPELMNLCKSELQTVDFEDMQWLPIVNNRLRLHIDKFDFVFIDEAQDLNACQIEFLLNTVAEGGRIVAVGDRKQSLYGFRGADTEAIPRLIQMLDAKTLPLSITYRCPKSHVQVAKSIVPQIEASETADEGIFKTIDFDDFMKDVSDGDMVICRTNAPLMSPAFQVIRNGNKAIIRGQEIGAQLVNFIDRFGAETLSALYVLMKEYEEKEVDRLLGKGKELQAEMLQDKVETIRIVAEECKTVGELTGKISILYSNENVGVVFSSIHRAKGLEASRVYVLRPELLPHPKAKQGWEFEQEDNTKYVAYTRSKSELYLVQTK